MNPLHIWLQYVFLWQLFTSGNHLQLPKGESSSYNGSGKYQKDSPDRSWTPNFSILPTDVSERIPMPTECWILKVLAFLIPHTSVITCPLKKKSIQIYYSFFGVNKLDKYADLSFFSYFLFVEQRYTIHRSLIFGINKLERFFKRTDKGWSTYTLGSLQEITVFYAIGHLLPKTTVDWSFISNISSQIYTVTVYVYLRPLTCSLVL